MTQRYQRGDSEALSPPQVTLSVVNLIANAIAVTRNILAACYPCISSSASLAPARTRLQALSDDGDSGEVEPKRGAALPGACSAAAMPLALILAPRGSARPGPRQGLFRYSEGCHGPLPSCHCKLMRCLLEASIRRPLWRFGVAWATAMT